jgi:hypothetical protein
MTSSASDPVPAVTEAAASGEIAAIFADIRRVLGVEVVNLVWRHLATIPDALPWTWGMLRPLYVNGTIAAEAAALLHPPAKPETSRFPCKELPHMPGSLTTPERRVLALSQHCKPDRDGSDSGCTTFRLGQSRGDLALTLGWADEGNGASPGTAQPRGVGGAKAAARPNNCGPPRQEMSPAAGVGNCSGHPGA